MMALDIRVSAALLLSSNLRQGCARLLLYDVSSVRLSKPCGKPSRQRLCQTVLRSRKAILFEIMQKNPLTTCKPPANHTHMTPISTPQQPYSKGFCCRNGVRLGRGRFERLERGQISLSDAQILLHSPQMTLHRSQMSHFCTQMPLERQQMSLERSQMSQYWSQMRLQRRQISVGFLAKQQCGVGADVFRGVCVALKGPHVIAQGQRACERSPGLVRFCTSSPERAVYQTLQHAVVPPFQGWMLFSRVTQGCAPLSLTLGYNILPFQGTAHAVVGSTLAVMGTALPVMGTTLAVMGTTLAVMGTTLAVMGTGLAHSHFSLN